MAKIVQINILLSASVCPTTCSFVKVIHGRVYMPGAGVKFEVKKKKKKKRDQKTQNNLAPK